MRVLVLVISDDSHPVQALHRELWRQTSHPDFRIVFLSCRPDIPTATLEGDTLWIPGEESFKNIIRKTIEAFDFFQNERQDYVIRTNLSSQFRWTYLRKFLEQCPRTGLYAGFRGDHNGIPFASGAAIYMSSDVVKFIRRNRFLIYNVPALDDVAIGRVLSKSVPLHYAGRTDMQDTFQDPKDHQHIRLKASDPKARMTLEIENRKRLIELDTNPSSQ